MLLHKNIVGDWLEESGWSHLITEANIASPGTAQFILKASHVKKTRHAHEVTAAVLHILIKRRMTLREVCDGC